MSTRTEIEEMILGLLRSRTSGKTICPSEAVRSLDPVNWRDHMATCREVAIDLARKERIEICQKGEPVEPGNFRGPIRLRVKQNQEAKETEQTGSGHRPNPVESG